MGYHVVVIPDQDDMLSDRTIFEYDWHVAGRGVNEPGLKACNI